MLIKEIKQPSSDEDRLIPMINIVFLLLIFFMVMGHIEKHSGKDVELPLSTSFSQDAVITTIVSIDSDGKWFLAEQPMNLSELTSKLALLEHNRITIKAAFNLKNSILNRLLDVLRQQQWQSIKLIVLN